MNELPSAAEAVLQAARKAHDPSDADVARSLARLSGNLTFAPEPRVGGGAQGELAGGSGVDAGAGLFTAKLVKLSLVVAALAGALGGAWMLGPAKPAATRTPVAARSEHVLAAGDPAVAAKVELPARIDLGERTRIDAASSAPAHKGVASTDDRAERELDRRRASSLGRPTAQPSERAAGSSPRRAAPPVRAGAVERRAGERPSTPPPATGEPTRGQGAGTSAAQSSRSTTVALDAATSRDRKPDTEPPALAAAAPTELALIDGAAQRLRTGDEEGALRMLDDHLALYPAGILRTERAGLRVLSLCALGRTTEGRLERAAFLRAAAGTPLALRVQRACGEDAAR